MSPRPQAAQFRAQLTTQRRFQLGRKGCHGKQSGKEDSQTANDRNEVKDDSGVALVFEEVIGDPSGDSGSGQNRNTLSLGVFHPIIDQA
jgi:hypothetical protein